MRKTSIPHRTGLARASAALLAMLVLLGLLFGALHSHTNASDERDCVVCALSHTSAEPAGVLAIPLATPLPAEAAVIAPTLAPASAPARNTSARAPPSS